MGIFLVQFVVFSWAFCLFVFLIWIIRAGGGRRQAWDEDTGQQVRSQFSLGFDLSSSLKRMCGLVSATVLGTSADENKVHGYLWGCMKTVIPPFSSILSISLVSLCMQPLWARNQLFLVYPQCHIQSGLVPVTQAVMKQSFMALFCWQRFGLDIRCPKAWRPVWFLGKTEKRQYVQVLILLLVL